MFPFTFFRDTTTNVVNADEFQSNSKNKYGIRRHFHDQHSGVCFKCSVCVLLFHRRNIQHAYNVSENDM